MPDVIGNEPILVANKIAKSFGGFAAVSEVSLNINIGECVALLGPNGAGKTTTCEMLEGLLEPDKGNIQIFGKEYRSSRKQILENVGVQLQETTLYKKYTVKETLQLFASFYPQAQPVEEVLRWLDLSEKANARIETLSGGLKQRVYLGCALIHNPKLLFLDEPTTGLDPQARRNIWDVVERLKNNSKSVLLTTHYMEEAAKLADRIAIIDQGRIIAEGSPESLIREYCKGEIINISFEGEPVKVNEIKIKLIERQAEFSDADIIENSLEISVPNAGSYIPRLIRTIDQLGLKIKSLTMRPGTLEDVFIKLTGRSIINV
ncbi:MAG: ABC transporter ATP-binding protein [Bdellovibrionota bacterium]